MKKHLFTILLAIVASTATLFANNLETTENPKDLFCFVSKQDGSEVGVASISNKQTIQYSLNGVVWNDMTTDTHISLNKDVSLFVRGKLVDDNSETEYTQFTITGSVLARGNINYLWDYEDFDAPLKKYCGFRLFQGCAGLSNVSQILFPSTTLSNMCYRDMFYGCANITKAPELPATSLAEECYRAMFFECSSLIESPVLAATNLATRCYQDMFVYCNNLQVAPELPATSLADSCYLNMFKACTSLTTAPALPATTLTAYCYNGMFQECTALIVAPTLPALKLADCCYGNMFHTCTSLVNAPALPATTLDIWCYYCMFFGCTSLKTAPALPAANLTDGCYYKMFKQCSNLKYIKCLATNVSAYQCLLEWVKSTSSSGTFVKHQNMNNWPSGVDGIRSGWSVSSVMPYQIFFDANGGVIPNSGYFGNTPEKHISWLNVDQKSGYIIVYSGDSSFGQLHNDCPTRMGYTFTGWYTGIKDGEQVYDANGNCVSGTYWNAEVQWQGVANVQLYAHWQVNEYTITWLQDDGTLIDYTIVPFGYIPTHVDPSKDATDEYTYTFTGWNPEVSVVTGDATYTATYSAEPVNPTSLFDAVPKDEHSGQYKQMINGQLYILRDGKTYTIQGQEIR